MSSFEVTPGDLESLAGRLSSLIGQIMEASARVSAGTSGAAQNGRLESSIDGFLSDWSQSLQDMHDKLEGVASKLSGAGTAYETTEQRLVGGFQGN
jgi:uncharacterized protein YukE